MYTRLSEPTRAEEASIHKRCNLGHVYHPPPTFSVSVFQRIVSFGQQLDLLQSIKLVVYSLLLINFAFYIADDIRVASFTMRNGGTLLEWTAAFTTTIDESAWFLLLFLLELETYVLSDEVQERIWVMRIVHGIRMLCYLFLAHSIYAFGNTWLDLIQVSVIPGVADLCQLVGPEISFVRNLEYTDLTLDNCQSLSSAAQFYFTEPGLVVSDPSGLALETNLALVDLLEVVIWLLILLSIEAMVRFQDRGITRGPIIHLVKTSKIVLYTALWSFAAWWVYLGHYYFAWDEALWIVGFIAIEMNMDEWKKEIEEADELSQTTAETD